MRRIGIVLSVLLSVSVLAGCLTDDDSPRACAYDVSRKLDTGQWHQALHRLESPACQRGMTPAEIELNRAAAYIGRAGYELNDLIAVALSEPTPGDDYPDLRFIRLLGGLGKSPGALRDLDLALQSHQRAVSGSDPSGTGLLQQACRSIHLDQLGAAEKDACFLAGLFSPARFAKALTLMLGNEAAAWRGDEPLSCENDRNGSGIADGAQATACAIAAVGSDDADGATCSAGTALTGTVRWEPVADYPNLAFRFDGEPLAQLKPIRIVIEPGAECTGRDARVRYRLIAPGVEPSLAVTEGACELDVGRRCTAIGPETGCWPCPIPRADGSNLLTMSNTLLSPVNREAELMLLVLPDVEANRVIERLESTRQRLCEPAEGTAMACGTREDGATQVRQAALGVYLEQ